MKQIHHTLAPNTREKPFQTIKLAIGSILIHSTRFLETKNSWLGRLEKSSVSHRVVCGWPQLEVWKLVRYGAAGDLTSEAYNLRIIGLNNGSIIIPWTQRHCCLYPDMKKVLHLSKKCINLQLNLPTNQKKSTKMLKNIQQIS